MTQGSTSCINLGAAKEGEEQGSDTVTDGSDKQHKSDIGATSTRQQKFRDVQLKKLAFDSDTSEVDTSHDHSLPQQVDVVPAHQQSVPTLESMPAARRSRKGYPRQAPPNSHLPSSSARLAAVSSPAPTRLKSTNLEIPRLHVSATDSSYEGESCLNDESADELGDKDYADYSNASSDTDESLRPRKRLRQSKKPSQTSFHTLQKDSAHSFEFLNQDVAMTPPPLCYRVKKFRSTDF